MGRLERQSEFVIEGLLSHTEEPGKRTFYHNCEKQVCEGSPSILGELCDHTSETEGYWIMIVDDREFNQVVTPIVGILGKEVPPSSSAHEKDTGYSSAVPIQQSVYPEKKRYWCHECGKGFSQSSNLQTHQRVHTGEKRYLCLECGKSFNQTSHLFAHLPIHTGEKPYRCESCGKDLSHSTDLNIHCRVHTGEKPYTCGDCGKCISCTSNLHTHQRVQTEEKPYKCDKCGKCFSLSFNLHINCPYLHSETNLATQKVKD
ncbi:zinc finger protein 235-like [Eumetopias jubatus]|uniref:zinc finger protein 235-like n=1 Tax=Eumetopias jubatus TaxID=34886 RepID=UPI0010171134|nr:zinc finger protein 235-like [Eumetopias jubatus]